MPKNIISGITSIISPTYVAEVSTADKRGLLGSCVQLMVTIGCMEVIVVGICGSWRWLTLSCLMMVVIWIACLFFIPESPVHYISLKRYSDAREALEWLRGTNDVEAEFEEIVRGVEESSREVRSTGIGIIFQKGNLAPFVISMMLMFGQQLSGMNAVMFYAVSIFQGTGSSLNSNVENIIIAAVQVGHFIYNFLKFILNNILGCLNCCCSSLHGQIGKKDSPDLFLFLHVLINIPTRHVLLHQRRQP